MRLKLFFAAAAILAVIASCGSSETKGTTSEISTADKDPMIRSWMLDSIDASGDIAGMPQDQQAAMKDAMASLSAVTKGKMIFDIREDHTIVLTDLDLSGKQEVREGKWALSQDKKSLTFDFPNKKEEFMIVALDAGNMNLELKGAKKMNMIFVPKQ